MDIIEVTPRCDICGEPIIDHTLVWSGHGEAKPDLLKGCPR